MQKVRKRDKEEGEGRVLVQGSGGRVMRRRGRRRPERPDDLRAQATWAQLGKKRLDSSTAAHGERSGCRCVCGGPVFCAPLGGSLGRNPKVSLQCGARATKEWEHGSLSLASGPPFPALFCSPGLAQWAAPFQDLSHSPWTLHSDRSPCSCLSRYPFTAGWHSVLVGNSDPRDGDF